MRIEKSRKQVQQAASSKDRYVLTANCLLSFTVIKIKAASLSILAALSFV